MLKILLFLLFSIPVVLNAQTSWNGTTSTNWATASNWTNGVPTSSVDAVIGDANASSGIAQSVGNYSVSRTTGITYSSISATGNSFASWRNSRLYIEDDNRRANTRVLLWNFEHSEQSEEQQMTLVT